MKFNCPAARNDTDIILLFVSVLVKIERDPAEARTDLPSLLFHSPPSTGEFLGSRCTYDLVDGHKAAPSSVIHDEV